MNIEIKFTETEVSMKLYTSIFIAAISMPLASIAGICSLEFGYVSSFRQALGVGVLVGSVMLLVAFTLFLAGVPSSLRRLRAPINTN
ncbi:hypothetical protein M5G10_26525 [Pseudomonas shahriarae]|nr:hypothetical protein [Pseudomonas shahriarae]